MTSSTRLRDIAAGYDLFFVDQFGVLHDGQRAYPGAIDAMARLRSEGRVVILSNSGKRSRSNILRMQALGFEGEGWDLLLSSGEVAWRMLARLPSRQRPRRCLVLSRDGDASPIEGLGIDVTSVGGDADLVLIAGSDAPQTTLDAYRTLLAEPAARRVPAMCVNPDMTMVLPGGGFAFGAGRVAKLYEELGGAVTWIGKPYPAIYETAVELLGSKPSAAVGIGDSVEHDIVGAKRVGADSALVLSGIHAATDDLESEFAHHGVRPDHIIQRFAW